MTGSDYTRKDAYSPTKQAVELRAKTLLDEGWAEREAARKRRWAGIRMTRRAREVARPFKPIRKDSPRGIELRRHLDKGRDVGDIAVRMRLTVSEVLKAIEGIQS